MGYSFREADFTLPPTPRSMLSSQVQNIPNTEKAVLAIFISKAHPQDAIALEAFCPTPFPFSCSFTKAGECLVSNLAPPQHWALLPVNVNQPRMNSVGENMQGCQEPGTINTPPPVSPEVTGDRLCSCPRLQDPVVPVGRLDLPRLLYSPGKGSLCSLWL